MSGQAIGTPSVNTSLTRDVYLTLQRAPEDDAGQTAAIRVIVQPLVTWLWIGGAIMAIGTILAAFPGRRRNPIDPVSAPLPGVATGDGVGDGSETTAPRVIRRLRRPPVTATPSPPKERPLGWRCRHDRRRLLRRRARSPSRRGR